MAEMEMKTVVSPNGLSPETYVCEIGSQLEPDGWKFSEVRPDGIIVFTRTSEDKKKAEEAKKKLSVVKA